MKVAITGMACRLPGGIQDGGSFFAFLRAGGNAVGGLDLPDGFDARFFRIPRREANGIDPQQRLVLELTVEALENAGIPLSSVAGSDTGVYMAELARDYDRMGHKDTPNVHKLHMFGAGEALLANRVSYLMDLQGPSITLDTGCVSLEVDSCGSEIQADTVKVW